MRETYRHEENKPIREIKVVTLQALQTVFQQNQTWTKALEPDSKFVQLLDVVCKEESTPEDLDEGTTVYSVKKIRCLAILYCEDKADEKIPEFWNMMQDSDQPTIAAYDKDFRKNLYQMFYISYLLVLEQEEQFTGTKCKEIPEEKLQEIADKYDEVAEAFLDKVFGYEEQLPRDEWMDKVMNTQKWVFTTKTIRKKLGVK